MQNEVTASISSWLEKTQNRLNERGWVACPICREEWNRLRACFFIDEKGNKAWNHVCLDCAENVRSLDWISKAYEIPGVGIELKWSGPKETVNDKYSMRHLDNQYAIISYGTIKVFVNAQKVPPYMKFKFQGSEELKFADNVFALWSMIRRDLENPPEDLKPKEVEKQIRRAKSFFVFF